MNVKVTLRCEGTCRVVERFKKDAIVEGVGITYLS